MQRMQRHRILTMTLGLLVLTLLAMVLAGKVQGQEPADDQPAQSQPDGPSPFLPLSRTGITSAAATGSFIWPVQNAQVTNPFSSWHPALDMVSNSQTYAPIYAADGGEVVFRGWDSYCDTEPPPSGCPAYLSGGNTIVLDHGNGYKTLYAHLQSFNVSSGDEVSQGEQIGVMGNSGHYKGGSIDGVHLHFEIRHNGNKINPQPLLESGPCTDTVPVGAGSGRQQRFVDAFNRSGGKEKLGCTENGAHWWGSGEQ